jgi:LysM repeat protein
MEDRNERPDETSNLPMITLLVLVGLILALLYTGYEYYVDSPENTKAALEQKAANKEVSKSETIATSESEDTKSEDVNKEPEATKEAEKVVAEVEKEKVAEPIEKPKVESKKLVAEIPEGGIVIPHVVAKGETFFGVANRFNLKSDILRALNPDVDPTTIKEGMKLKVKIKAKHTVGPGDVLRVVAEKYNISKKQLMDANKLTKDFSKRGDELLIPFK